MKLYYSPGACSLSPHIVLREAGLPFTPVLASTKTHKLADGTDYYTINPKGYVPLLELDDGQRLTEGPAIVQYIADQVPDKKLVAPWRHDGALPPDGVAELHRHRAAQGLRRRCSTPRMPEEAKAMARTSGCQPPEVGEPAARRHALPDGRAASRCPTPTCSPSPTGRKFVNVDISSLPHLGAFMARMAARPAVQEALKAEGLIK